MIMALSPAHQHLLQQKAEIEVQIERLAQAKAAAIAQARELVEQYRMVPIDVFSPSEVKALRRYVPAPRYRNPATGQTWSGRGRAPRWIEGQDRRKFAL